MSHATDASAPRLNKLPFWLADAALLTVAAVVVAFGSRPLRPWEAVAAVAAVAWGGWLAVLPFLRDHEAAGRVAGQRELVDAVAKLGEVELLAERVASATQLWQSIQDRAQQTAGTAKEVVDRLARESEAFASAVSRTADSEKQTLKLEVEKLRRGEGEWLGAVGRIMDHTFALHAAALRSSHPGVAEQIDRFYHACRESLRRLGFAPILATPDEPFDPRKHQTVDGNPPPAGALVQEVVAPGFVYQGKLLRPIVVKVGPSSGGTGTGEIGRSSPSSAGSSTTSTGGGTEVPPSPTQSPE